MVTQKFYHLAQQGKAFAALLVGITSWAGPSEPQPSRRETVANPPYKHAMIFNGGNLDIYQFFGMYDAAVASGNPPDLIIGTCGGALAAAIIKVMPDPEERRAFIRSPRFHEYMKNIKYTDLSLFELIADLKKVAHLAVEQKNPESPHREVPNPYYKRTVMSPKNQYYYEELNKSFEKTRPSDPELVILSNEMLYDKSDVGRTVKPREKLYRETIYTSKEMAAHLRKMGIKSRTGLTFPDSFIGEGVRLVTDETVTQAARNSFTDPYLIHVDEPQLTGAVSSLSALEVAKLAKEVSLRYPPHWDRVDGGIMMKFFGLDPWAGTEKFASQFADRWIDTTDPSFKSVAMKIGFVPTPGAIESLGVRLKTRIPKFSTEKFRDIVDEQYAYGWENYMEASRLPKNTKTHISRRIDTGLPKEELERVRREAKKEFEEPK